MGDLTPVKTFSIATDGTTTGGEIEIPQRTKEVHIYCTTLAMLVKFYPATGGAIPALSSGTADNVAIVPAGLAAAVVLRTDQSPRPNRNAGGIIAGEESVRNYKFLRYDAVATSGTGTMIVNCLG